ncbi:MAG: 4Fe-4S dicluster domain-containing protein [Phyllobacteriaceae bacterium]|nr:4Fe-4S dicluster domain-containing protein [Phyllobacteriaceae bacterium]
MFDRFDEARIIGVAGLETMIGELGARGHAVVGPVRRDGAIVLEPIESVVDLPRGWVDEQTPGRYRLKRDGDSWFAPVVGPQSWKQFLHPPRQKLWTVRKSDAGATIEPEPLATEKYAFIGVRACEIAAIAVQDRVFMQGPYVDPNYAARRANAFIVAVNCSRAASTCFCPSMKTGPRATAGYDLALTELSGGDDARFLIEIGSAAGQSLVEALPTHPATKADIEAAAAIVAATEASISRTIDTGDLPELLKAEPDHPRWDDVAARCLNCANCTMACPTCFCTTVVDESALDGASASRSQRWDSCFTGDFSHVHGGAVRQTPKARYRQWMTHKLSTWHDQFAMSGCVGCGRCIVWCPVGIDITEEAAALRRAV